MIVITGAAGFIGSCLVALYNERQRYDLLLVDDFSRSDRHRNYAAKQFLNTIDRREFLSWLDLQHDSVEFIFHLGARTDTVEPDQQVLDELNIHYTQALWQRCAHFGIPMLYASTAATYGSGAHGYDDDLTKLHLLQPLNPYGRSKHAFDIWAVKQEQKPPGWWGIKFFNVYGPNEYHKRRMASVVFHGFHQIRATGKMTLFRSHRPEWADGEQTRDFIYVKDVVHALLWFYEQRPPSSIYNLGSGVGRTFFDLARATFAAMGKEPCIEFVDIPEDLRHWYQYFTVARMDKLRQAGYQGAFHTLEQGVGDYVTNYLMTDRVW